MRLKNKVPHFNQYACGLVYLLFSKRRCVSGHKVALNDQVGGLFWPEQVCGVKVRLGHTSMLSEIA